MALDRPRNNLDSHITWFNSQKPQIPRPCAGPAGDYTQTLASVADGPLASVTHNTQSTQLVPPMQIPMNLARPNPHNTPVQANLKSLTLAMPEFSESKPRELDTTASSSDPLESRKDSSARHLFDGPRKEVLGKGNFPMTLC
jgi:hypothetical protein